jgi:hypothetical protein
MVVNQAEQMELLTLAVVLVLLEVVARQHLTVAQV